MPRAMPSDYAAADDSAATLRRDPGAAPTVLGRITGRAAWDRERPCVSASPGEAPDPTAGIEAVRVGGTAVPDPSTGSRTSARIADRQSRRRWHDHLRTKHGCGGGDRGWSTAHDRSGRLRGTPYARAKARVVRRTDGPVPRPICFSCRFRRPARLKTPRAVSSVGRAPARQAGGHWFEPSTAHLQEAPLRRGLSGSVAAQGRKERGLRPRRHDVHGQFKAGNGYKSRFWPRQRCARVLAQTLSGFFRGACRRQSPRPSEARRNADGRHLPPTHWPSRANLTPVRDRDSVPRRVVARYLRRTRRRRVGAERWFRAGGRAFRLDRRHGSMVGTRRRREGSWN